MLLADGWEFARDPDDRGLAEGWANAGGTTAWTRVGMPHVVEGAPLEQHFGGTVAWYRLAFNGPATPAGSTWALRFEQARRTARVWLNGVEIGSSQDPYVPFELAAVGLRPGELNQLVVRVDSRRPAEVREGWWNWGGMIRPAWLIPQGAVSLRELGLLTRLSCRPRCGAAAVILDGEATNRSGAAIAPTLEVTLVAPAGTVTRKTINVPALAPGASVRIDGSIAIRGAPALWAPDHPHRYNATVRVRAGGDVVHEQRRWIGLRSVDVSGGRLRLNGRAVQLRGASIQEDVPARGAALTGADIDWIGRELKAIGADATRAHYALSERLLNRLDKLGVLVWSQAPIYHRDDLLRSPAERAAALATVRGTVLATRSHPSVITHSVGNEFSSFADARPGTRTFLRDARRLTRRLDPTLPASVDLLGHPDVPRQRAYAGFDLLGANVYFGWYRGRPARPTAALADLAPYLRRLHRQYRRQAIVVTEFGAEAITTGPVRTKGTHAFQARYVRRVLGVVDRMPFVSGSLYWTLREFAVKPRWYGGAEPPGIPRDGIHDKGLVTYDGRRKAAWYEARRLFRATPLYARPARRGR